MAIIFTKENFQKEVLESEMPVLVDFWATWCAPCRALGPIIEEIAQEFEGKFKIGKLNVDENEEIAQAYQIFSVPTLIIFKQGQKIDEKVGALPKQAIVDWLKKYL
jgi:thioredoxin 1